MPRGGPRQGAPGKAYGNRSDLNLPVTAPTGQAYGARAAQVAQQQAIPMARPATDNVPAAPPAGPGAPSPTPGPAPLAGPMPGQVIPLDVPSQRPNEPVTAGLSVGPGAGPEALGPLAGQSEDVGMQLRAIYSQFPNEDIRGLLELLDDE